MLYLAQKIPRNIYVAVSGGPDSMAVLDFLRRGGHNIQILHFNHGTKHGEEAERFVIRYAEKYGFEIFVGNISQDIPKGRSKEDFWREERYRFFRHFNDCPIILAHNLDDVVETWLFSAMNGNPTLIPYSNGICIRPFILNSKRQLLEWCERKNVPYVFDPSNADESYARSRIRNNIMPEVLQVNPGIHKVMRRKYKEYLEIRNEV